MAGLLCHKDHEFILSVKRAKGGTPKDFIDETMKDWPGGTWMVLELDDSTLKWGKRVFFIGYKYNRKTVQCFLFSERAGGTYQSEQHYQV